jgi:uncharacterized protein YkwD
MHLRRHILIAVAALAVAGCSTAEAPIAAPPPPDPATQMVALESRINQLIVVERFRLNPGASPLALDSELVGIARQRSEDLAKRNTFANPGEDTHVSATMLMDRDAQFQGLLGENLAAQHYSSQAGVDVDAFARRFVDGWLASEPHRQNLTLGQYNRTGVGASVNGDTVYVVQLFATDLGLGPHVDNTPKKVTEFADPAKAVESGTQEVRMRGSQGAGP